MFIYYFCVEPTTNQNKIVWSIRPRGGATRARLVPVLRRVDFSGGMR